MVAGLFGFCLSRERFFCGFPQINPDPTMRSERPSPEVAHDEIGQTIPIPVGNTDLRIRAAALGIAKTLTVTCESGWFHERNARRKRRFRLAAGIAVKDDPARTATQHQIKFAVA